MTDDPIRPRYKKIVTPKGYANVPDDSPPPPKQHLQQKRGGNRSNPIKLPPRHLVIRLVFPPYLPTSNGLFEITERPAKNMNYTLEIGGKKLKGKTDENGLLKQEILSEATSGILSIDTWRVHLVIGDIGNSDSVKGVKARLSNLGLLASKDRDDRSDDRFWGGITRFTALFGTTDRKDTVPAFPKIKEIHGS